jgi:23S rRNA pseudouridine1911/1915/1917 synthase
MHLTQARVFMLADGRPHQIRIHLAFIGHPLAGDPLYAAGGQPRIAQPGLPGDPGYWLHAKRLAFKHPLSGEQLDLTSPLPDSLQCCASDCVSWR